jgi:hypothetical protein
MLAGATTDIEDPADKLSVRSQLVESRLGSSDVPSRGAFRVDGIEIVSWMRHGNHAARDRPGMPQITGSESVTVAESDKLRVVSDSRYIRYIERLERKQKPRPGLWLFNVVLFGIFSALFLGAFLFVPPAKGGEDWGLLILAVAWATTVVPISIWRMKRDRRRQASWVSPAKS